MLAQERLNDIVRKVNEEGSVRVRELAAYYEVTEDCIRKDLTSLEKQGLLKRIHGGALPVRVNLQDLDVTVRKGKNIPEKIAIARKALSLIQPGNMIFLDISTISLELARLLRQQPMPITVVTNMTDVMLQLNGCLEISTILIGGSCAFAPEGFVGALANEQIRHYRFDLSFLGTVGLNAYTNSLLTYIPEDGLTKSLVLSLSRKAYVMMETSKFYTDGTYQYGTLQQVAGLILNQPPALALEQQLRQQASHLEILFP